MGYSMIHVDKVEPSGPGGAVRFVRRVLGVEAFGINWFEIPANTEGREHDELETARRRSTSSSPAQADTESTARRSTSRWARSSASTPAPFVFRSPARTA